MHKNIFLIVIVLFAALCFFTPEKASTENIKCHNGYEKKDFGYICKNPTNSLSYQLYNNDYYLNDIYCGNGCNPDGTNCKRGVCDKKELAKYGFTEIKGDKFYNPTKHLSYYARYQQFYIDDILCGYDCNLDGKNCDSGICDKNILRSYGYTEIKGDKFYNPAKHLAYYARFGEFFLDDVKCGSKCNWNGTNCKSGTCDRNILTSNGYTEIKDNKFYNPNTKLSLTGGSFYLNGSHCGNDCNFDGTNCKTGFCNVKNCKNGYTQIKDGECYNPVNHLSYNSAEYFSMDGVRCGYKCDLNGANCQNGNCNFNTIAMKGYTEKYFKAEYDYHIYGGKRLYNPQTHISFKDDDYYLENVPCGFKCDLDGRNCKRGICNASDCANGYKNLDILITGRWNTNYLIPVRDYKKSVVCHNNSKYYDVFEPQTINSINLKNIQRAF